MRRSLVHAGLRALIAIALVGCGDDDAAGPGDATPDSGVPAGDDAGPDPEPDGGAAPEERTCLETDIAEMFTD